MKIELMKTRRKWYVHGFRVELQKLIENAPTSKDASLTQSAVGLSNISKYPGNPPDIACYNDIPRNQDLVGIDGVCVNRTLHMVPEEEV
ncbi:uncharacterized protein TNCV_1595281 [Trichonephila clavipes]|nr:uncharacterized protein TNCV_1595281 [Trichonephila clavipes]